MTEDPRSAHNRFRLKTADDLRSEIRRLKLDLQVDEDMSPLGETLSIAGRNLTNRFAVHPMEGYDSMEDGSPGPLSHRRYRRYAKGGFSLIWFEATAVLHEARSNPGQLYLHRGNVSEFRKLVEGARQTARETYGHDIVCILQLTHSGRYSRPDGFPEPITAHHSPVLDPLHGLPKDYPLVNDEYLDRLQDTYVAAAGYAREAGFDGVDIKSCHRYLVSELLASFTREGRYGGSFENRTRLLVETLSRIKDQFSDIFITTRMNAYDAIPYPYGFGTDSEDENVFVPEEPLKLARLLESMGAPVLNVTIGNPYYKPQYGRPYDFPVKGSPVPADNPLAAIDRFARITAAIQKSVPAIPVLAAGYSWLRHLMPFVASPAIKTGNASILGIGRGAFAYPDTPRDIINKGRMDPLQCCITCSACTQIMRDGGRTGCVVRDSGIYGPEYRKARRFALDNLLEQSRRCRDCEEAACSMRCPAGVDVPAFIKAFAEGDIEKSYSILRQRNVLPELCGLICPSEVQCEGGCLENIFCRNPVPIADIQLAVCRLARRKGITGIKMPSNPLPGRTAVIGSGPAGLAATAVLLEKGRRVALFDKAETYGGTPEQIVPSYRCKTASAEIDAILQPAIDSGRLEILLGKEMGKDIDLKSLRKDYDAVLLTTGLDASKSTGDNMQGSMDALEFLAKVKSGEITDLPERVAVIGAGNTAMDAAVSAIDLGARDVYAVYRRSFREAPAWPSEIRAFMEKNGHFLILSQPISCVQDNSGKITGLKIARTRLGRPDESGRRRPEIIPQSETVLPVDMVIEAIGQEISHDLRKTITAIPLTDQGLVKTRQDSFETELPRVYSAGDSVNGGTTAVQAVAEGMAAAEEIHSGLPQS